MGTEFDKHAYFAGKSVVLDKLKYAIINDGFMSPMEGRIISHIACLMSASDEDGAIFDEICDYFKDLQQKEPEWMEGSTTTEDR